MNQHLELERKPIDKKTEKRVKTAMIKYNLISSIENSNYLRGAYRSLCLLYPDNEDFRNKYQLFCEISKELRDIYNLSFLNIKKKGLLSWTFINEHYDIISNTRLKLSNCLTSLYKEDCLCGALEKERNIHLLKTKVSENNNKKCEDLVIALENEYNVEYADLASVLELGCSYGIRYIPHDYTNLQAYNIYYVDGFDHWCYVRKDNDTVYKCKIHKE